MNIKTISMHKSKCILVMVFSILSISIIEIYGQEQSSNLQDTLDSLHNVAGKEYIELRDKFLSEQNALEFLAKLHKQNTEQPDWLVNALYIRAKNSELARKVDLWLNLQLEEKILTEHEFNERLLKINPDWKTSGEENSEKEWKMPLTKFENLDLNTFYYPADARQEPPFSMVMSEYIYKLATFEEVLYNKSSGFSCAPGYLWAEFVLKEQIQNNDAAKFILFESICESFTYAGDVKKKKSDMTDYIEDVAYYKKAMLPVIKKYAKSNISWQKVPAMIGLAWSEESKKDETFELFLEALQNKERFVRSISHSIPIDISRFEKDEQYRNRILNAFQKYWELEKSESEAKRIGLYYLSQENEKWAIAVLEELLKNENDENERIHISNALINVKKRIQDKEEKIQHQEEPLNEKGKNEKKDGNSIEKREPSTKKKPDELKRSKDDSLLKEKDKQQNLNSLPTVQKELTNERIKDKTSLIKSPWFYFSCGVFLILVFAALFYAIKNRRK